MIVIDKKTGKVLVLFPMGARAREALARLREKGLDFEYKPVYCG